MSVKMEEPRLVLVTPLYNDWECLPPLFRDIETALDGACASWHLLVVNDCSTIVPDDNLQILNDPRISRVNLLTNVGHQRAILVGLCHIFQQQTEADIVVVIDSDGEDRPQDIPGLVRSCMEQKDPTVVFARRAKRSEGWPFVGFYRLYKLGFRLLTGRRIVFGNYSCFPSSLLSRICHSPDFWNHYSSALIKSRIPYLSIPTKRGSRYSGTSKMNFNSLILHGLSSFSVYIEAIIVRVLISSFFAILLLFVALAGITYLRAFTPFAIPGWASFLFGILLNVILTVFFFNIVIILSHLNARKSPIQSPMSFYKGLIQNPEE